MLEYSLNPKLPMIHAGMFKDSGRIVGSLKELSSVDHKVQLTFEASIFFYAGLNGMAVERQTVPSRDSLIISWYPVSELTNKKEND